MRQARHVSRSKNRAWTRTGSLENRYDGIYEWDLTTGESRRIVKDADINRVLADRIGKYLFINTSGGEVRILDAKNGLVRWSTRVDEDTIEALTLSPDERRLAVGDRNGQVYVWNLELSNPEDLVTSKTPEKLSLHNRDVYDIVFTADGKNLVTASRDGSVRRTPLAAPADTFREVAWLSNKADCAAIPGTSFVVATGPLAIYERSEGKLIKTLSSAPYYVVAASSDGMCVAAASSTEFGVWSVATGERILKVDQKVTRTKSLDFSPNSSLLAVSNNYPDRSVDSTTSTTHSSLPHLREIDMPHGVVDVVEIATGKSKSVYRSRTLSR